MQLTVSNNSGIVLSQINVLDEHYQDVIRYAKNVKFKTEIAAFLEKKNCVRQIFTNDGYQLLIESLIGNTVEDVENFIAYLRSGTICAQNKGNLLSIFSKYNISNEFIQKLVNMVFVDSNGNNIGPGEIFFAIFFNDVTKSVGVGDLQYQGKQLEVKCRGGRFGVRPQKTLIPPASISESILKGFNTVTDKQQYYHNIIENLNFTYSKGFNLAKNYLDILDFYYDERVIHTQMLKTYVMGSVKANDIGAVLFIDKKYNYSIIQADDIPAAINAGTIQSNGFRSNDFFPQVFLRTSDHTA